MNNELTLWGIGTSRTMRAHWMLLELGLDYVSHSIRSRTGGTLTEEFKHLNPRHKIPVLQHESFVLTESAAIVLYLSEQFAEASQLYFPNDTKSRAVMNEWCYFIISELDAASLYVARRHESLAHTYGEAPAAVEAGKAYFLHNLEAMTPRITDASPYLFGERLSAADILLVSCLDWASLGGISLPNNLTPYRERTAQRPAYEAAMKRNFPELRR
jgi:glutathione S-transferase